ncbi:MAG TPA: dTDP-glucose 4,6-dehydratase [Candidatus Didemnitutus sp.]|nr:dTDP-glucose 4,6-dehydratase [Candidatus Didemnitutus sp.]
MTTILITGGAGFIGSNLVRMIAGQGRYRVIVLDALTYAGNLENLDGVIDGSSVVFVHGSINNAELVHATMEQYDVDALMHLAAESHVDRSIVSAAPFIETNVTGTLVLLEAARTFGVRRFLHVSTDEVYGTLGPDDAPFTEQSPLDPTSPYAASKASSDLLVTSFVRTHGLDAVITRCSNNYGPYQFPEKFIPLMTLNAIEQRPLPVYGDGRQVRDWLHVDDHCRGLLLALEKGAPGEVYNLGGFGERTNIDVAHEILRHTDGHHSLIEHVTDRKAHDRRYAINATKAQTMLEWEPTWTFDDGLKATVEWYQHHQTWCNHVRSGEYRSYYQQHYHRTL